MKRAEQFKHNIVKKYFLKRLSSYFERFKEEVKGREIERWRHKFQDSIRGMLMLQALQKAIKKIRSYELNSWNNKTKKYFGWKEAIQRLGNMPLKLKEHGFKMVKRNMFSGRIELGTRIISSYEKNNVIEGFNQIYRVSKLMKIVSVMNKSWRRTETEFLAQLKSYSKLQGSHR